VADIRLSCNGVQSFSGVIIPERKSGSRSVMTEVRIEKKR
jgi:hypothetical protein